MKIFSSKNNRTILLSITCSCTTTIVHRLLIGRALKHVYLLCKNVDLINNGFYVKTYTPGNLRVATFLADYDDDIVASIQSSFCYRFRSTFLEYNRGCDHVQMRSPRQCCTRYAIENNKNHLGSRLVQTLRPVQVHYIYIYIFVFIDITVREKKILSTA